MMKTKNQRIQVTFEKATAGCIANLAKQHNTSIASVVRELALEALELREDYSLSKLAQKLDTKGVKTYGHDTAWA